MNALMRDTVQKASLPPYFASQQYPKNRSAPLSAIVERGA
jgi:hypothetical protein